MTFYVENETEETFAEGEVSFSVEDTVEKVANAVLEMEGCPYEVQLNVLLTDNDGIHAYNKEYRNIDRETDVLSFPNLDFAVLPLHKLSWRYCTPQALHRNQPVPDLR